MGTPHRRRDRGPGPFTAGWHWQCPPALTRTLRPCRAPSSAVRRSTSTGLNPAALRVVRTCPPQTCGSQRNSSRPSRSRSRPGVRGGRINDIRARRREAASSPLGAAQAAGAPATPHPAQAPPRPSWVSKFKLGSRLSWAVVKGGRTRAGSSCVLVDAAAAAAGSPDPTHRHRGRDSGSLRLPVPVALLQTELSHPTLAPLSATGSPLRPSRARSPRSWARPRTAFDGVPSRPSPGPESGGDSPFFRALSELASARLGTALSR